MVLPLLQWPLEAAIQGQEGNGTGGNLGVKPAGAVEALRPVHRAPEAAKAVPPEQSHLGVVVIWSRWRLLLERLRDASPTASMMDVYKRVGPHGVALHHAGLGLELNLASPMGCNEFTADGRLP